MTKSAWEGRTIYQLFSGVLFVALGVTIFIRGDGFRHFLNIGLFGLLLTAYGVYRLSLFAGMIKKTGASRP
jgi:hypothetical protein